MTLTIMNLEAQLLEEIKERQEKLEKLQGVSPKLQALESLLAECKETCEEFGMSELFLGLLGDFTGNFTVDTPKIKTPTPTPQLQNIPLTPSVALTDKEAKAIRQELKNFLAYEGQRLNDATAKNLLIEKLEELNKTNLLSAVNLDDKENFLVEAKKLINLLTLKSDFKEEVKEEVKTPDFFPSTVVVNNGVRTLTPTEEVKEEGLNPKDAVKSALVQNLVNGYYGTIEQDGVINGGALVRYPNTTELTPLQDLKLVSPAIFTPTPITPLNTSTEEIKEEGIEEEEVKDMTPQEKMMWDALLAADFTPEELTALSTDKETVDGFNSTNGTNLTSLPIAELYEYTMGVGRIE